MPDPGSVEVGKAHVEVSAENSKLETKIEQAKAKTEELGTAAKATGASISDGMDRAASSTKKLGAEAEKTTSAFGKVAAQASKVRSIVSKLAIPAAVLASFGALVGLLTRGQKEAEALAKAVADVTAKREKEFGDQIRQARAINDLAALRTSLIVRQQEEEKALIAKLEEEADKENVLLGLRGKRLLASGVNLLLQELGLRRSLRDFQAQTEESIERTREITRQQLLLLDQEEAKRRAIAEKEAQAFENQTRLLEAQANGQQATIREQLRQLAQDFAEKIDAAESEAEKNALRRRFAAMNRLLVQQLQDIERAAKAQEDAAKKAADLQRQQEEKAHQQRLREIEIESKKRLAEQARFFREQKEGFDRINQELVVGLKGISAALNRGRARDNSPIITGGGG